MKEIENNDGTKKVKEIENNDGTKKMKEIENERMFDFGKTIASVLFETTRYPFEILPKIKDFLLLLMKSLKVKGFEEISPNVWAHKSAKICDTAQVLAPCVIDEDAFVRHGAFLRGNVLVGKGAVVGNSSEVKNSILFDGAKAPHFNYVGDSVMGANSHVGAGVILSNLKSDKSLVAVFGKDYKIETHLKKVGGFLGDNVEIGCGSVLCPGSVICKNSQVYPLSLVRGVVSENTIYKAKGNEVLKY